MSEPTITRSAPAAVKPIREWNPVVVASVLLFVAAIIWFFCFDKRFGGFSVLGWLESNWNPGSDYEHGMLFPFVIAGLIGYQFKNLRAVAGKGSYLGLIAVFVGALFYVISCRTLQPRIGVGALPFLLWGGCYFLWGWRVAKLLAFPFFFFWLAVPLPSFQQATTGLQLLATSMAHHGSSLFGVETTVQGTTILPVRGDWEPLDIASGCSGIRSLMALLMISSAWAYVAKIKMWQKAVLLLMALPLAIIGNTLRVTSIFVIAEYGDAEWAAGTWHDWSGLLLFYPFSLALLLLVHSLFEGGLPWKRANKRKLTRKTVGKKEGGEAFIAGS
ncbi:MAG: exosortase/archaeosortase family protein [Akkermansiaceae bacterium]|nr:exosortase/archaeosortase family protein [Akkermansiaceae bacterium]MDP4645705.1 exosortase/archaeosortase family protein [Akkermansiaceae bacterium]MDP4721642.1 exosortase/archaeosortase family protein [Akkermansiaceae bacterium]MDP4778814.1 exosortase/archaeosortase family protein [Akkermansiaceae bacterium]MDP4846985.1 exosortase/archaeosortase family protein [Akkermansiaceae bacterium]